MTTPRRSSPGPCNPQARLAACRIALAGALLPLALADPARAQHAAGHGAHVHGQVQVNVAVQGHKMSVQLEMPLDSLLGFEHRPRTEAQRRAAQAAVQQVQQAAAWLKPDPAAQCTLSSSEVNAQALEPAPAGTPELTHAELQADFEFSCAAPDRLTGLDVLLFDRFSRVQRLQVQVAGAKAQSQQTLRRPATRVRLR